MKYEPKKIESKWQKVWDKAKLNFAKDKSKKDKRYVLIEFPYPSGEGLHMGHLRPYVAGDVYARFQRMRGYEVMYPMGWDAFGLPAENFAIKKGVHPSITTAQNIKNAKKQVQNWGMSFDWSREVNTTDPEYYKWTQWIFLQFYKAGLAYEATGLINWCPKDKTGLANEEVIEGKCERCGTMVEKKEMRQWYLRITAYAEKLLEGLKNLPEWPEQVKLQQENWIGKSEGAEIEFPLATPQTDADFTRTNADKSPSPQPSPEQGEGGQRLVILHGKGATPQDNFYLWLKKNLEDRGYKVQVPDLPNSDEPDDLEQTEHVIKNCQFDENTVVIGHSFGGIVALRLLERGIKLRRVVLVATPFTDQFIDNKERPTVSAALRRGFDFEKIKQNCGNFTILSDIGDDVVPVADGKEYARKLQAEFLKVRARGPHFRAKEEPGILESLVGATSLPTSPQAWGEGQVVKVFTTRPDTIFGATYMVLAPEHPMIRNIEYGILNIGEVRKYIEQAKKKTDVQRSALDKEKTGVELKGVKAINPATGEKIPVWIADYVLMGYGTGAIMAVPAHDERDFEFAIKYNLPIKQVIVPKDILKAIVVTVTLESSDEFKKQLQNKKVYFTLGSSPTNGREHIRVELKKDQVNEFASLVQKHIKENAWVEIIGSENILVIKNKVHKNFLERAGEWFEKFKEWEPLVKNKKSVWDMLAHNPHYRGLICYIGQGALVNSGKFDGMESERAKGEIAGFVNGIKKVQYKLRDWVFSRQRYWGEPIPLVFCGDCKKRIQNSPSPSLSKRGGEGGGEFSKGELENPGWISWPESKLPVELPKVIKYEPTGTGESPLANIEKWLNTKCPKCGGRARRETNTMPQWAGSSWYYLRYADPKNKKELADQKSLKHWLPVDIYFGGMEHTTLHLLYSRFWNLFLHDQGVVPVSEPYTKRVPHGIILAEDGEKMSKSRGNVVNPDEIVALYGADTLRMYELFLGPHGETVSWNSRGIVGVRRFLEKVWRISLSVILRYSEGSPARLASESVEGRRDSSASTPQNDKLNGLVHKTIKKVMEDIEDFRFNTAVSALMILANEMEALRQAQDIKRGDLEVFLRLLAPFAPHISEELWNQLGHKKSIHLEPWPEYDPKLVREEFINVAVQINGKVRGTVRLAVGASESEARKLAEGDPRIQKYLGGKQIEKFIYVKGKIINFVIQ